ncbi:MAG: hypothetical protein KF900_04355 [Bacteroidetes bacterium]|nr:hypothetical protein [Bacteroidota bacterium]
MNTQKYKLGIIGILLLLINNNSIAQSDTTKPKREYVAYTLFYNVVPDQFNFPLIGFVNVAKGNHQSAHLGFVNTNLKNFSGLQMSFVNTTLGAEKGAQMGFVNTVLKDFEGLQMSFVNTTFGNQKGIQMGFVNTVLKDFEGLQMGFVNTTFGNQKGARMGFVNTNLKNFKGLQMAFVNTVIDSLKGAQFGFVNTSVKQAEGFQMSFVNLAVKGIQGIQIGFVNIADSISKGIPFGFISYVRKGGYRAVEISASELYPVNLAFKIGIPKFYTFIKGAYNSQYQSAETSPFGLGMGLGSLIPLGKKLYLNPEIENITAFINEKSSSAVAFAPYVRYKLNKKFQVAFAPSIVWANSSEANNMYAKPLFALYNKEMDTKNSLLIGARLALSFNFTDLN